MTRRLILIRHAKSSWEDPSLPDRERPLNPRGRHAAAGIGGWLASRGYRPQEVLCSAAQRTAETWEGIAPHLPAAQLTLTAKLYQAGAEVMLAVLRHAQAETVMMLGHNPGIADFADRLLRQPPPHPDFAHYPTAATLVAEFPIDAWADLAFATGAADDFVTPKDLDP